MSLSLFRSQGLAQCHNWRNIPIALKCSTLPQDFERNRLVTSATQLAFSPDKVVLDTAPTLTELPVYAVIRLPDDLVFGVSGDVLVEITRFRAGHPKSLTMNKWLLARMSLVLFFATCSWAQTLDYLPEIDTFVKLNSNNRFWFQAKQTREDGSPNQAEIGPSMEFFWKGLNDLVPNGVDGSKTSLLLVSLGYRYVPSPNEPSTHRILLMATPRIPVKKSKIVMSDRNRGEINFSNDGVTWRYRNRLQFERQLTIRSYHPTPFANVEVYYDSEFQKWSSTAIQAGCQFPLHTHIQIDLYYEHENNTGVSPGQQINAIGSALNLHF